MGGERWNLNVHFLWSVSGREFKIIDMNMWNCKLWGNWFLPLVVWELNHVLKEIWISKQVLWDLNPCLERKWEETSEKWVNSRYPFRMLKIRLMETEEEKNWRKRGRDDEEYERMWLTHGQIELLPGFYILKLGTIKEPRADRWNKSKRDTALASCSSIRWSALVLLLFNPTRSHSFDTAPFKFFPN